MKSAPNVKCKPDGKVTPSRFWLKAAPNVKLCKPDGKVTSSRFWLKAAPNVKLCKPDGKVTPSRFWLKAAPNVKQTGWNSHALQVLVKDSTKRQALQTGGGVEWVVDGNEVVEAHEGCSVEGCPNKCSTGVVAVPGI